MGWTDGSKKHTTFRRLKSQCKYVYFPKCEKTEQRKRTVKNPEKEVEGIKRDKGDTKARTTAGTKITNQIKN